MFRFLVLAAALCAAISPAHARLFWQTYGATVATADGCAWNMGTDYFVPRTCDSCRYDLFSACKSHHGVSPACRNLHPVYGGYCTPYGACHYKFRDCVYAKRCGCTPLACTYGPWELEKCSKHGKCCRRTPDLASCCGAGGCALTPLMNCDGGACPCGSVASGSYEYGPADELASLPNVEPFGVEVLGTVQAFPGGTGGAAMGGGGMPMPGAAALPGMSAPIPGVPQPALPGASGNSNGFAYPNF